MNMRRSIALGPIMTHCVSVLLLLGIVASFIPTAAATSYNERIQPVLYELAADRPHEMVRVIVQKTSNSSNIKALVLSYGGKIIRNLRLINAFVAEMPAKDVPRLGRAQNVRWISLDAEVIETSQIAPNLSNVRDEFVHASYGGNNGTEQWLDSWTEIGENDGAEAGDVEVIRFMAGTKQGLRIQGMNKGAQRSLDLNQVESAELTFTFRRKDFGADDYVTVEASPDGEEWVEAGRIAGPASDGGLQTAKYDIPSVASNEAMIRFVSSASMSEEAKLYVDSVDISYTRALLPPAVFLPLLSNDGNAEPGSGRVWAADLNSAIVTVRDEFGQVSYDNSDGTDNWISEWIEANDAGTPDSGNVRIINNQLKIAGKTSSILRKVNLAEATVATLSFDYRREGLDNPNDYVAVEIASHGASDWTELVRMAGPGNDSAMQSATYDITNFVSNNTTIRFVASVGIGSGDHVYLDNIEIAHDGSPSATALPNGGVTYTAPVDRDTYIDEDSPNTNKGHKDELRTTYNLLGIRYHTLIHYDIPAELAGCSVASARAFFHDTLNFLSNRVGVHRLTSDWGETTATWNNAPSYEVAPSAMGVTPLVGQRFSIDVTPIVQEWLDGKPNYGLMLSSFSGTIGQERYSSREGVDSRDPYLEIDAVCGAPIFIGAKALHDQGIDGSGVTVAVVDSGIAVHDDFLDSVGTSRIITQVQFNDTGIIDDYYGHGTHVAGAIAGSGTQSGGAYFGVAPGADLIDVKVSDDYGAATNSDVIAGLEWILNNKTTYNIGVVNVSLNSSVAEPYHVSPLNAALEILWFNGIVVVVSAGNNGSSNSGILFPPANDPFLITVGGSDDKGTPDIYDNEIASFSAYGTSASGFAKPDLIAPGVDIISTLAGDDSNLAIDHPAHAVPGPNGNYYFRMSGTSMASAVLAGSVALLLQADPSLTPDQVKYRLIDTANPNWPNFDATKAGAGLLDIKAAVNGTSTASANTGIEASQLLWTGNDPVNWGSVNWGSVNWGSVNWGSVNWGSVNWGSVNWGSDFWDD